MPAGIDLDARLVTADREGQAGSRCNEPGMFAQPAAGDDERVVQTRCGTHLRVLGATPLADQRGLAQVERRPLDGGQFPRRYAARPRRKVAIRPDLEQVAVDRRGVFAFEVDVGVVGEVDDRRGVGVRHEVDAHLARGDGIRHLHGELTREAAVAVGADQLEGDSVDCPVDNGPGAQVEAIRAAVQRRGGFVGLQRKFLAIQAEPGTRDAVGVAPDDAPEVGRGRAIVGDGRVPQDNVAPYAAPVPHVQSRPRLRRRRTVRGPMNRPRMPRSRRR